MAVVKVILLESNKNLGKIGSIVSVKGGYARNFLVPKKKAKFATKIAQEEVICMQHELELNSQKALEQALLDQELFADLVVNINCVASDSGKLFGSVSKQQIAKEINANIQRQVQESDLLIRQPIKSIGKHTIGVKLHPEVITEILVVVNHLQ